ncbi:hypothetical protein BBP00_00000723 [Phytophthora kernoviae]|uniref:Carbonic anhydrase n=1 Tax=Phytophthora kernoviae TaxID=325452 RepID=A0A3F2S2B8_9STRA|nr:hypothetical protein BBP00_00000723 [Phytophthora kernoviae]
MMNSDGAPKCLGECASTSEKCFHSSKSIQHLLDNNKKWREELVKREPKIFDRTAEGQHPSYLWIGCADSRVPAEEITGLDPGEMFCHRNVANLVVTNDINVLSVVQYAVENLMVKDIIVCGHYGCGGVKAAMENKHIGLLDTWLRTVRDVHRKHQVELDALPTEEARYRRMVELNVKQQCLNIFKTNVVQHRLGRPTNRTSTASLNAYPDDEPMMGKAHQRRNMILDLADGLEKEPGMIRIHYMARMLKREAKLFTPEEVDEAIEAIKGQMEDPESSLMPVKSLIDYFAAEKPKETA